MSRPLPEYAYRIDFKVRDYECDLQGIVNNANYLHYLEHARHEYMLSLGLDFADLHRRGIVLTVIRAELDYKMPLASRDTFWVGINTERVSRLKFAFLQDIYKHDEHNTLVLRGRVVGTSLNAQRRPEIFPEIESFFP